MKDIFNSYARGSGKDTTPLFTSFTMLIVTFGLAACATDSFLPVNKHQNTVATVHIPVAEEIYLELPLGSKRHPYFQINIGKTLLGDIVGNSLGAYAGRGYAGSRIPASGVATLNPWVAMAIMTAGPIINSTVEAMGQEQARK